MCSCVCVCVRVSVCEKKKSNGCHECERATGGAESEKGMRVESQSEETTHPPALTSRMYFTLGK